MFSTFGISQNQHFWRTALHISADRIGPDIRTASILLYLHYYSWLPLDAVIEQARFFNAGFACFAPKLKPVMMARFLGRDSQKAITTDSWQNMKLIALPAWLLLWKCLTRVNTN